MNIIPSEVGLEQWIIAMVVSKSWSCVLKTYMDKEVKPTMRLLPSLGPYALKRFTKSRMIWEVTILQPTDLPSSWSSKRQHKNDADACQANCRQHWLLPDWQGLFSTELALASKDHNKSWLKTATQEDPHTNGIIPMLIRDIADVDVRAWLWIVENLAFELLLETRIINRCIRRASAGNRKKSTALFPGFHPISHFNATSLFSNLTFIDNDPLRMEKKKKYFICLVGRQITVKGDSEADVEVFSRGLE